VTAPAQADTLCDSIKFRDQFLRGTKSYSHGTHRAADPADTLNRISPFLPKARITRIADVTGLDTVGIPTTLALRPNAPTMACASGKGLTLDAAIVSGAMEAIELHAAETANLPVIQRTYNDLAASYNVVPYQLLPKSKRSVLSRDWPFRWVLGWDIVNDCETAVPLASVEMSRSRALLSDLGAFMMGSNGLASGNTLLEAIAAGLYEVVERDAVACSTAAWATGSPTALVNVDNAHCPPLLREVLDRCIAAEVLVAIYDCTVDTHIPTYIAYVCNLVDEGLGLYRGYGAHLDGEVAMLRAVTEALQGRLNFIAGSRDDIFRAAFWRNQRAQSSYFAESVRLAEKDGNRVLPRVTRAGACFEEDVHCVLNCLKAAGLNQVIVIELTPDECPVSVVRVVVPGLEGYMHFGYARGLRAERYSRQGSEVQ
jgi:ribosomal protein S12 methylthiotransferase accessory factor